jgi:ribosomal protein S18 acetylase RimI-like enzyme
MEGLWRCIDTVARERRWLGIVVADSLEDVTRMFETAWARGMVQYVAIVEHQVVGWCDILPKRGVGFRHCGQLGMGVLQPYRGRGIGAALLDKTVKSARSADLTRIELSVYHTNEPAIALYRKYGFVQEGRQQRARVLDGREEDLICMAMLF